MKKISILLIVLGITFLGYGGYQIWKTNMDQNKSLAEAKSILDESNYTEESSLTSSKEQEEPISPEDFYPDKGEAAGILHIPRLESDLPVIEGTHEDELSRGVGHYEGTAYPLQKDQIVLSGHRDTVFRRMGELELGDILTLQMPYGDFEYEIVETKIVDAEDRTIIVPTAPDEVLTVTTCYPFNYVGHAPDRYIINAVPVAKDE